MSTRVDFWCRGEPIRSTATILLCKAEDQYLLAQALQESDYTPHAYSLSPNGESLLPFIAAYLFVSHDIVEGKVGGELKDFEREGRELLKCCEEISGSMRYHCPDKTVAACDSLLGHLQRYELTDANSVPVGMQGMVEYIRVLTLDCLAPLAFGSPFIHQGLLPKNKSWWSVPASAIQRVKNLRRRITTDFGMVPFGLSSIDSWLEKVGIRLDRLHATPSTDQKKEAAIFEASSYCAALAERHLMQGQPGLAVLLLHRSVDLLLMSLCVKNGMIDFSAHGGKYKHAWRQSNGSGFISLRFSLDNLKRNLASHPTREADLNELNEWRNTLMQTHYMTELSEEKASELFKKTRFHLQLLGGSDWTRARDTYLSGVALTTMQILNFNGFVERALAPISY